MKTQEIAWLLREKLNGMKSEAFQAGCVRLASGEPLAYIIGSIPFLDCTIHLDSLPLIPRPETEYWTEQAIQTIQLFDLRQTILDLCAGSGAIGVAVARAVPTAKVTFGELDYAHLHIIKKNLRDNAVVRSDIFGEHYFVVQSNLFENISGQFDFILCNPPYIDKSADTAEKSVTDFEPHLALFGGVAGMELITKIITQAPTYLTPTGQLWLEHEPFQSQSIATLAEASGLNCVTHLDQYDIPRYSVLSVAQY